MSHKKVTWEDVQAMRAWRVAHPELRQKEACQALAQRYPIGVDQLAAILRNRDAWRDPSWKPTSPRAHRRTSVDEEQVELIRIALERARREGRHVNGCLVQDARANVA